MVNNLTAERGEIGSSDEMLNGGVAVVSLTECQYISTEIQRNLWRC